jgi:hypothetical protein
MSTTRPKSPALRFAIGRATREEFLSIPQKAAILNAYGEKNLDVQFMGDEYLGSQVIAWHQKHDPKAAGH